MDITPYIQEILSTFVIGILGIVSVFITKMLKNAETKLSNFLDAKTTNEQRELINKYAKEAFSFAETVFNDLKGEEKLLKAKDYLQSQLKSIGVVITDDEIKAIIEKAVLDYNKDKKS